MAARRVGLVALASVVLRVALSFQPIKPDESGYLLIARTAHSGGPFLYGDLWVDRPPLLIGAYRIADELGGLVGLRSLAVVGVVVLVVAAGSAGWTLARARGAWWSAVVAAGFACTPLFAAPEVDGEIIAVPLVMVAVAIGLHAQLAPRGRVDRARAVLLGVSGFVGACAVMVKQNFTDALVLLGVLLLVRALRRELPWPRAAIHLGALVIGACLPVIGTVAWAASWHGSWRSGVAALWGPLIGFRSASLGVITDQSLSAPLERALELLRVSLVSGLFLLFVMFVLTHLRALRRLEPLPVAITAMLVAGQPAIALGGSFWPHYLIELIPAAALAIASMATRERRVRWIAGVLTAIVAASALVTVPLRVPGTLATGCSAGAGATTTGRWLARAAEPGDTVAMIYSGVTVVEKSGLRPAYPYQWSLPLRTLDPHVKLLRERLSGPDAAVWVVESLPLDSWHLDASGRLSVTLVSNYRPVASVCGRSILLRDDVERPLPPIPAAQGGA